MCIKNIKIYLKQIYYIFSFFYNLKKINENLDNNDIKEIDNNVIDNIKLSIENIGIFAIKMVQWIIEKLKIIYPNDNFTYSNSVKCYKKYKEYNGYMGWHTNHNQPGDRWYFVYNLNENSSFMRFIDPKTEEMITMWEPKGWSLNHFVIGDEKAPLWHCIHTDSERWSIGIKKYN